VQFWLLNHFLLTIYELLVESGVLTNSFDSLSLLVVNECIFNYTRITFY